MKHHILQTNFNILQRNVIFCKEMSYFAKKKKKKKIVKILYLPNDNILSLTRKVCGNKNWKRVSTCYEVPFTKIVNFIG